MSKLKIIPLAFPSGITVGATDAAATTSNARTKSVSLFIQSWRQENTQREDEGRQNRKPTGNLSK